MAATLRAPRSLPLDGAPVARICAALDDPDWLRSLREAWWDRYGRTPFPSGKEEEWRRADLTEAPFGAELLLDPPPPALGLLGVPDGTPLAPQLAEAGVVFTDLRTAVREHPELVRTYLGSGESLPSHAKFWALAQAAWTGGVFLHVPAGVDVDGPLLARTSIDLRGAAHFPQTIVVAGPNSRVTLVEEFTSGDGGEPGWTAGAVDLRAAEGARVRYVNLQRLATSAWNLGFQRAEVGPSADLATLNVEVGSRLTKLGTQVRMTGDGGTSRLLGVLAAGDDQVIDVNSYQDLAASHTTSELLYLSALYERARASFYGIIRVRPGTRQTSSYQECRNLLLSPHAGAEPIPVLEIESNDILRCGHGATAGALDPTQLFYAQTRGLDPDTAAKMIVRGFFEQVLGKLDEASVKELMLAALAPRIGRELA
ncbi:MAG: SufD family Fe-S cluster assembly protein [Candidatus Limnocylindria bacterium]